MSVNDIFSTEAKEGVWHIIGESKGGGGSGGGSEQDDTLRSKSTARVLDLIGEGVIEG